MSKGVISRFVFLSIMLISTAAMPAGGGVHASNEIPWSLIAAQTFNFVAFVGVLAFLLKKFLAPVFPTFRQKFLDESTKAQREVAEAEKQRKEIENRLSKLETTYSSRLEKAKKESVELKNNLIKEAQLRSEKIVNDASESAMTIFKNTERQFKMMVLSQAIETAKTELPKSIDEKQLQRLHGEFLEEIRVNP